MTEREIVDLLDAIDVRVRRAMRQTEAYGVVTQASPLRVRFNDDTDDVPIDLAMDAYTPTQDDEVLLIRAGRDWICLGSYS